MNSVKLSGGIGYYYGWGSIDTDSNFGSVISDFTVNDIFFQATAEYLFTRGFGVNVRYDEILGFNFGLSFIF